MKKLKAWHDSLIFFSYFILNLITFAFLNFVCVACEERDRKTVVRDSTFFAFSLPFPRPSQANFWELCQKLCKNASSDFLNPAVS